MSGNPPRLPHYAAVKMRCPTCDGNGEYVVANSSGGTDLISCRSCGGGCWVDLPATVECEAKGNYWGSLTKGYVTYVEPPSTERRPAPWAKAELGDEVECYDADGSLLDVGIVEGIKSYGYEWMGKTPGVLQVEPHKRVMPLYMPLHQVARIVTPGSEHEQARAAFGVGWDGQR